MEFSRVTFRMAPLLAGSLLLLGTPRGRGQQSSQSPPPNTPAANGQSQTGKQPNQPSSGRTQPAHTKAGQTKASKKTAPATATAPTNPAVSNPFPMAQSEAAAKADAQQNARESSQPMPDGSLPPNPQSSGPTASNVKRVPGQSSPAKDNPFPEAQSKAAAKAEGDQSGAAGSAGSGTPQAGSSSSSGGYSSSNKNLPAPELGEGNVKTHTRMDSYTRDQNPEGRVDDDLNAADFYMKNGNYRGGYLRYQDALEYDPANDTAQYGIAEALCKENVTGEAMAHFKSYLTNDPQGKYTRRAEEMLTHPERCMHNR